MGGDTFFLEGQKTFQEALEHLYRQNFTGRVTLHFLHGSPRILEYGCPNRIDLVPPPQQKGLDKPRGTTYPPNR